VDDDIATRLGLNRQGAHIIDSLFTPAHASANFGVVVALGLAGWNDRGCALDSEALPAALWSPRCSGMEERTSVLRMGLGGCRRDLRRRVD
jgi:hypothetical protein